MSRRSPFPRKDVERLVADLEFNQSCKVQKKSKGYWIGFPNGASTTVHFTSSDTRAIMNVRSVVIRNGCTWPL